MSTNAVADVEGKQKRHQLFLNTISREYRIGSNDLGSPGKIIQKTSNIRDIIIKFTDSGERLGLAETAINGEFDAVIVKTGWAGNNEDWIESKWLEISYEKGQDENGWNIVVSTEYYPMNRVWIIDVQYKARQVREEKAQ